MFDEKFCVYLEYALSGVLSKSSDFYYRGCWCDGIRLPENRLKHSRAYILKYRMVETEAWIYAENFKEKKHRWPTPYNMRIFFGDESINKVNARERLEDCVPTSDPDSWIRIDMVERWIDIQLP